MRTDVAPAELFQRAASARRADIFVAASHT
jgi:hypothetical protein